MGKGGGQTRRQRNQTMRRKREQEIDRQRKSERGKEERKKEGETGVEIDNFLFSNLRVFIEE